MNSDIKESMINELINYYMMEETKKCLTKKDGDKPSTYYKLGLVISSLILNELNSKNECDEPEIFIRYMFEDK